MTTFPAAGYPSNAARTQGEMKTYFEDTLAATKQMPGPAGPIVYTIASGVVTPAVSFVVLDTEGAAATDDLTNIAQTNMPDGSMLVLMLVTSARTVRLMHAAGGVGQLALNDVANYTLRDTSQRVTFLRSGTQWLEVSRTGDTRVPNPGRLDYNSATTIILRGSYLPIWFNNSWVVRQVPDAGITLSNEKLSASTVYYVYATNSGSSVALVTSTTAPAFIDGVMCMTGDITRTLVGAVRTNASSQFPGAALDDQGVLSYFGRKKRVAQRVTSSTVITSTTYTGLSGVTILCWAEDSPSAMLSAAASVTSGGPQAYLGLHLDSTLTREQVFTMSVNGSVSYGLPMGIAASGAAGLARFLWVQARMKVAASTSAGFFYVEESVQFTGLGGAAWRRGGVRGPGRGTVRRGALQRYRT